MRRGTSGGHCYVVVGMMYVVGLYSGGTNTGM